MHKIDSPGATGSNTFTEGNPAIPIAATEVSDDWLNDVQGELVTVIEGQGIVLAKGNITQLQSAIDLMIAAGGSPGTELSQAVINNQAAPLAITSLLFNKASFQSGRFEYSIFRRSDSSNVEEAGTGFVSHNAETDLWRVSSTSSFDDGGVTFLITSGGQVQYTSNDLTGASYSGTLRINNIRKIKQ